MNSKKHFICAVIITATLLISHVCLAAEIEGVTKSFNSGSGSLVIKTTSYGESAVTVPQTVQVFIKIKKDDIEVEDVWNYLRDNLRKGTKIKIEQSGGLATTIWILEVPQ